MRLPDPEDMRKYLSIKAGDSFDSLPVGAIFKEVDDTTSVFIKISSEFAEEYCATWDGKISHTTARVKTDRPVFRIKNTLVGDL